VQVGRDCRV